MRRHLQLLYHLLLLLLRLKGNTVNLDLSDLLIEDIEVTQQHNSELTLESLPGVHAMLETGGSSVSTGIVLCSCCCCC